MSTIGDMVELRSIRERNDDKGFSKLLEGGQGNMWCGGVKGCKLIDYFTCGKGQGREHVWEDQLGTGNGMREVTSMRPPIGANISQLHHIFWSQPVDEAEEPCSFNLPNW
jgi:hypothetical protein